MIRTLRAGLFALGLLLLAHGTSSAAPISVTMYDYDATHGGNPDLYSAAPGGGGAFWAVTSDPVLGSLLTFCLEVNEHIAYGGSYNFNGLQADAVNGGGGAVNNADPVSDASRWLYLMVSTGLYSTSTYSSAFDFNGSTPGLGSVGSLVQMAIWVIEQEAVGSYALNSNTMLGNNTAAINAVNALVTTATNAVSSGLWSQLQTAYNAHIGAMNLYSGSSQMQSQLGGTWRVPPPPPPVPEPASLVLLGSGLLGVGLWRRRSLRRADAA